jgi:hypothetical protein
VRKTAMLNLWGKNAWSSPKTSQTIIYTMMDQNNHWPNIAKPVKNCLG